MVERTVADAVVIGAATTETVVVSVVDAAASSSTTTSSNSGSNLGWGMHSNGSGPTCRGLKSDHSLFIYRKGIDMAYLLLYVNDIILTTSSDDLRKSIMTLLNSEFAMKDLGPLSYFLGIAVTRHAGGLFLSQKKYAEEIIERASMSSCRPSATPVDTIPKLSATPTSPFKDPSLYRSLAGALQYLTFTRPDISYAMQQICLFMHNPMEVHMNALKRIVCYIKGTLDHGLHLYPSKPTTLISYTDAN
ncbi:uncharacterized mitochondrial protein AtMg00810-like [Lycium barbarum]|uniref:uncharacterized mitochondrial protein AtMg00810-like n=1 Tax=Lycium barbarum TaxID=112863 RepID=UPI00293EF51E|nr:uncharacterized mitochondrial protein AtMg00810-like [Lycium barbarum]